VPGQGNYQPFTTERVIIARILPTTICPVVCHSLDSPSGRAMNMQTFRNFNCLRTLALLSLLVVFTTSVAVAADVHGTVTNAQGGEPLGKIQVAIAGTGFIAATGADGKFHFSLVPPGPMRFRSAVWDTALCLSPFSSRQQTRARNSCSPLPR